MSTIDYVVLFGYLVGVLVAGAMFAGVNNSSAEMFAAGGRSPWWAAGLSGFMTMFSAGTFVIWGGIAFKHGLVAICINFCYGVAALLVGYFVAGHWQKLGIRTPAEFVRLRFGIGALHFYTWSMMLFRMVGVGVALYSLAVLLVEVMPLAEGNPLRDPSTGKLSLPLAILIFGGIVVAYTLIGGLWAVLIVDVLQFIVLNLAVLFVVVLSLKKAGGLGKFIDAAPEGFFAPVAGQYAWWFLAGWCAIHFFTIGAELAFVQRYLCVPTEKDARKGAYLFGVLYLVSPLLWMLPPMLWRIGSPIPAGATLEQINVLGEHAYIQQCKAVLPAGMIGMMLAAMFSATASTVSGQLNVFAGVLTNDIYRPLRSAVIGEQHLVWIGRLFTLILGLAIVAVALSVPRLGGAEGVVIGITIAAVGPLTAPVLWGLLNRRVNAAAVWVTAAVCLPLVILAKLGPVMAKWSSGGEPLSQFWQWLQANQLAVDIALGALLPMIVLTLVQAASRGIAIGWQKVATLPPVESLSPATKNTERLPAQVVGWSLAACSATMTVLTLLNEQNRGTLGTFAAGLFVIAAIVLMGSRSTRSDRYAEVCTERTLEHVEV